MHMTLDIDPKDNSMSYGKSIGVLELHYKEFGL